MHESHLYSKIQPGKPVQCVKDRHLLHCWGVDKDVEHIKGPSFIKICLFKCFFNLRSVSDSLSREAEALLLYFPFKTLQNLHYADKMSRARIASFSADEHFFLLQNGVSGKNILRINLRIIL